MSYDYSVREPIETILRDRYVTLLQGYLEDFQIAIDDMDMAVVEDFERVKGMIKENLQLAFTDPSSVLSENVTAYKSTWFGLGSKVKDELTEEDYDLEEATGLLEQYFDEEYFELAELELISYSHNQKPCDGWNKLVLEHEIDGVTFYTLCKPAIRVGDKYREMENIARLTGEMDGRMKAMVAEIEDELLIISVLQEPIYLTSNRKSLIKHCSNLLTAVDNFNNNK